MVMSHRTLGCSTISFRAKPLSAALETIRDLGFNEIDLGAIPSVVDHVPMPPSDQDIEDVGREVRASGLGVRVVNADPGPLSDPDLDAAELLQTVRRLSRLAAAFGADLVVPCGASSTEPIRSIGADLDLLAERLMACSKATAEYDVRLIVEAPHHYRLCHTLDRTRALLQRVDPAVAGVVLDASHVVAAGADVAAWARETSQRTDHVHLRDAVPGNINLSIGNGRVDFPGLIQALQTSGYRGHYCLELETHDLRDEDRPEVTATARDLITDLLNQ
jgi:sugar phosphate isomerase/epimerase